MPKGELLFAVGKSTSQQLSKSLRRMGLLDDFDPFAPPKRGFQYLPLRQWEERIHTPGRPYPPGYYTNEAVKAEKFDKYVGWLEKKKKFRLE